MSARLLAFVVSIVTAAGAAAAQPPVEKPKTPPAQPVEKPKTPPAPAAQNPAPPAQTPPAQVPPAPAAGQPQATAAAPTGFTYQPEGRRDPFVSLLGRAADPRSATNRPTGLAGVLINEVVVTGIIRGGAGFVATLKAPDNKTYIVKSGERLMDGTVKSISDRQVVFSQDVNDPLSLIKQREIPKSVRPGGESNQ